MDTLQPILSPVSESRYAQNLGVQVPWGVNVQPPHGLYLTVHAPRSIVTFAVKCLNEIHTNSV